MSTEHEVKVTLSADDQASGTLGKVEKALADVSHGHDKANAKAKAHGSSLWAGMKSTAIGTAMGGAIVAGMAVAGQAMHKGVEEITDIFHAGLGELEGRRSLAGVLTMTDQSGASFDMMLDKGTLFKDQLEDLGVEAGVADDAIQSVFEGIAARSNKSAVEVAALTESVVYAGRAVPGGAGALAAGFAQMEQGVAKARNPVVQLIAASHVLKGNAKSVAAQLSKMAPDKMLEIAEKAMERMGTKMKAAAPTFGQLMTSMKGVKEQVLEAFGVPMVDALLPALGQMKEFLVNNKDDIIRTAGDMVRKGAGFAKDTYDWGKTIWDTVNTSNVREMLVDGAHALTAAWGLGATVVGTLVEATAGIVNGLGESYKGWKSMLTEAAEWGFFGATGEKAVIEDKRGDDIKHGKETGALAANPFFRKQAQKDLEDMAAHNSEALEIAQRRHSNMLKQGGASAIQAKLEGVPTLPKEYEDAFHALEKKINEGAAAGEQIEQMVAQHDEQRFADTYKKAASLHEEGKMFYMTKLLAGDEKLQDTLLKGGFGLEGTFAEIANRMKEAQGVTPEQAEKFATKIKTGATGKSPVNNFNGGQTFNIKQDFRDQDPDRIAVIFRQDILKASNSRVQSSRAGAFAV